MLSRYDLLHPVRMSVICFGEWTISPAQRRNELKLGRDSNPRPSSCTAGTLSNRYYITQTHHVIYDSAPNRPSFRPQLKLRRPGLGPLLVRACVGPQSTAFAACAFRNAFVSVQTRLIDRSSNLIQIHRLRICPRTTRRLTPSPVPLRGSPAFPPQAPE